MKLWQEGQEGHPPPTMVGPCKENSTGLRPGPHFVSGSSAWEQEKKSNSGTYNHSGFQFKQSLRNPGLVPGRALSPGKVPRGGGVGLPSSSSVLNRWQEERLPTDTRRGSIPREKIPSRSGGAGKVGRRGGDRLC
jgi:hypothetical protein